MPRLPDAAATTPIRDDRRTHALRTTGVGALAATAALAWAGAMRPDLLPVDGQAGGTAALAVALASLAACGLLVTTDRERRAGAGVPAAEAAKPPKRRSQAAREHDAGAPMRASVDELAEAIGAARIARVLILDATGEIAADAVALARRLASSGEATILADFAGGRTATALCSVLPTASIGEIVASPTTFAHGIHRDRSGRAHVMATVPGADDEATATSLDCALVTLEEVYRRTVAIVPPGLAGFGRLLHADAAIVVPGGRGEGAALERLAQHGIEDAIVLTGARQPG